MEGRGIELTEGSARYHSPILARAGAMLIGSERGDLRGKGESCVLTPTTAC